MEGVGRFILERERKGGVWKRGVGSGEYFQVVGPPSLHTLPSLPCAPPPHPLSPSPSYPPLPPTLPLHTIACIQAVKGMECARQRSIGTEAELALTVEDILFLLRRDKVRGKLS